MAEVEREKQQLKSQLAAAVPKEEMFHKLQVDYRKALTLIKGFIDKRDESGEKEKKNAKLIRDLMSEIDKLKKDLAVKNAKKNLFVDQPVKDHDGQVRTSFCLLLIFREKI